MRSLPLAAVPLGLCFCLSACAGDDGPRKIGATCSEDGQCVSSFCYQSTCLDPSKDDDGDSLINQIEMALGTRYDLVDTDGDGKDDPTEVGEVTAAIDLDSDGFIDAVESSLADADNDCIPDESDPENHKPASSLEEKADQACCCKGSCEKLGAFAEGFCESVDPPVFVCAVVTPDEDGDKITDLCELDSDGDGAWDDVDNCVDLPNPDQIDADDDDIGDACDDCVDLDDDGVCDPDACPDAKDLGVDADGDDLDDGCDDCIDPDEDGVCDPDDSCPGIADLRVDADGDHLDDACDDCVDPDADGVCGAEDACPGVQDSGQDGDGDGLDDACDPCPSDELNDEDSDGHCAQVDNCPAVPNESQADEDEDLQGDACDPCPHTELDDADFDGKCADEDNCPDDTNADQLDTDDDGKGNACDPDDDDDTKIDPEDHCPLIPDLGWGDTDEDGKGDLCDEDDDNDGIPDEEDLCPLLAGESGADLDGDGEGDECDEDIDGDGLPNDSDPCPESEGCEDLPLGSLLTGVIPTGEVLMGCSAKDTLCFDDEKPSAEVEIAAFAIERHEVTQQQYAAFAVATDRPLPACDAFDATDHPLHPAVCVPFPDALAYCEFIGRTLPTELQWVKAARGGCELFGDCAAESPIFPWGDVPADCTHATMVDEDALPTPKDPSEAAGIEAWGCSTASLSNVAEPEAATGTSPYEAAHMAGNAWEWTTTFYSTYATPAVPPSSGDAANHRIVKGGGLNSPGELLRISFRARVPEAQASPTIGFRCVSVDP